jgi:hypothetical protein
MLGRAMDGFSLVFLVVSALLWALFLGLALRSLRRRRLVADLPTSKTAGVFIGLVECRGTAESEAPLRSHLAEVLCVHYQWRVEEHWEREVTETSTDSEGNVSTHTSTETGTTTVARGGESGPFWLQDETGVVRVVPAGADLNCERVFRESCGRLDPLYYGKGPRRAVSDSTHRRTFTEIAIPLHHELYVIGRAQLGEGADAPEIAEDPDAPLFVISTDGEDSVRRGYAWGVLGWSSLAFLMGALASLLALSLAGIRVEQSLSPEGALALYSFGFLGLWSLGWAWTVYNGLIDLRHRVRRGDSLIDIELKRRAELIPNLTAIVQAVADHEAETQRALALLRSQAAATRALDPDLLGVAPSIRLVVERHPELVADRAFTDLQSRLVETEDRIARARAYANELAANYNTRVEQLPDRLLAGLARLTPRAMFQAADFERRPIQVDLVED